ERWAYHAESLYLNEDGKGDYVRPAERRGQADNFGMIFPNAASALREGEREFQKAPAFAVDGILLDAARRARAKIPPMRKAGRVIEVAIGGAGVSGPVFVDNAKYREWIFRTWQARCVDMESTALAHVAHANRKPILIVRGLSDLAGGQAGSNPLSANEAPVSGIAARMLRAILEEL
ncbi:MAG TPA: 5'-nucleosidase, partial [Opitutaceae bacterium]|nr:5'-nucleosidase [Opitutaceae bacterium]